MARESTSGKPYDGVMSSAARNSLRGRRAARACSFCRLRKFRCNNELPSCLNCVQPSFARLAALEEENRRLQQALQDTSSSRHGSHPSQDITTTRHDKDEETRSLASSESSPRGTIPADHHEEPDDSVIAIPGTPIRSPVSDRDSGENTVTLTPPTSGPELSQVERAAPVDDGSSGPVAGHTGSNQVIGTRRGGGSDTRYHGPTSTLFDETAAQEAYGRRKHAPQNHAGPSTYWVQKSLFAEAASERHLETINLAAGKLDFDGVDPDLGMHLLSLHWNRQHHSFLITYRPAFMRDMACGGPYFSRLLLNAIFFGASKFSNRLEVRRDPNDVRTAGWLFRERVRQLLGSALDRSDITTIQGLLVMTSSLFALGDERSAAWLYAGTAFRMIIDLGMHVDGGILQRGLTEEDVEIRRRVFWGAFVVDKIQSLYQGRPVSLQEIETSVPLAFNDEYEELEHWRPFAYAGAGTVAREYPGSPAYSVSCFTELCRLSLIMNRILNSVYAERSLKKRPEELAEDLKRLHADLESWKAKLPPHLNFDPAKATVRTAADGPPAQPTPPPHVLSLLAMHNVLLILLHRPFVSDGHLHVHLRALSTSSFLTCAQAATAIVALLRAYNAAFSVRRAPYLISYATYVAATIHVRIAAQPGFAAEAKEALAVCLMVFDENFGTNWAVKRARAVIGGLMQRMGVTVDPIDATNTADNTAVPVPHEVPTGNGGTNKKGRTPRRGSDTSVTGTASVLNGDEAGRSVDSASRGMNHTRLGNTPNHSEDSVAVDASPSATATFDIDAIISSFISDQQPPLAAAFKSLPSPENEQRPQQLPGVSHVQHISPHNMAAFASPSSAVTAHSLASSVSYSSQQAHNGNWFTAATPAAFPLTYQSILPSGQAPHPSVETASSYPGNNNSIRFTGYNAHATGSGEGARQGVDADGQQPTTVANWQQMGGDGDASAGQEQVMNVHASDLLFGFNSSVVDGIGWEFEASRNYQY
ncbi:Transcription factor [Niveomyces insectorum RCEF 264]|uniref:Transcription factor n=1 Tax=Niveomyces insectorum RCEF 264 TaxID=1081102 RepID=A0A167RTK8_9HYPO|nr:Transcription factor [Niveomyces insectorum RCEF 264]